MFYAQYCAFGSGRAGAIEIDSAKFVKLCRETRLFDAKFTQTDADLIFTKASPPPPPPLPS